MTRRERLEMIIRGEITEELINECKRELEKLNEQGARVLEKSKETERYKENKEYEEKVYNFLDENPVQIGDILAGVAPEMSRQRMTAICTNLVKNRRIGVIDVKVKGKGTRRAYYRET